MRCDDDEDTTAGVDCVIGKAYCWLLDDEEDEGAMDIVLGRGLILTLWAVILEDDVDSTAFTLRSCSLSSISLILDEDDDDELEDDAGSKCEGIRLCAGILAKGGMSASPISSSLLPSSIDFVSSPPSAGDGGKECFLFPNVRSTF